MTIREGDLVMVVHVHCAREESGLGQLFTVQEVAHDSGHWLRCSCGAAYSDREAHARLEGTWLPVAWLKKIDPPKETVEHKEEITA